MDYNNEPPKIVFEDEQFQRPQPLQTPTPKIIELVIKYSGGYIKDEKQASYFLIGFVAIAIIISLFLFFSAGGVSDTDIELQKQYPTGSSVLR